MLRFLRKRRWGEHVKLATQNLLACQYMLDFEESSVEAGLKSASPLPSIFETDLETANGYLSDLRSGEPLPAMIVRDALQMNRERRRDYAAITQARSNAAVLIGVERRQLLSFDQMFTPNDGWSAYFRYFRGPLEANPEQSAAKQVKDVGQSLEDGQYLNDLVGRGEMAGMDAPNLRKAFENVEPAKLRKLAAMGADLARQDREQNVRVALTQMMGRQAGANPPKMRFFLVDRSIPALEPEPGSMLLLRADGTWGIIVPREVLADEGSPEVSKEVFVSRVAELGGSMPRAS